MRRSLAVLLLAMLLAMLLPVAAGLAAAAAQPAPSPTPTPVPGSPPGERNPLVGLLAVGAIVVAAGAGLSIYRVIRRGL